MKTFIAHNDGVKVDLYEAAFSVHINDYRTVGHPIRTMSFVVAENLKKFADFGKRDVDKFTAIVLGMKMLNLETQVVFS